MFIFDIDISRMVSEVVELPPADGWPRPEGLPQTKKPRKPRPRNLEKDRLTRSQAEQALQITLLTRRLGLR